MDPAAALAEIDREIGACQRCDLFRTANRAVPGTGPVGARIMLVGEAPGFNEDKQGRPFVGAAGKFLDELLAEAGLKREDVYITNVVKHRPPNNRDPAPEELQACRPWLEQQIRIIDPRLIVTLGRFSMATLCPDTRLPGNGISRVHGQIRETDGRFIFLMYHPAAALHQQALRQTLLEDMRKLGAFIRTPEFGEAPKAPPPALSEPADEGTPEQLSFF
jgi:uracil-DNA glycosylase family 4